MIGRDLKIRRWTNTANARTRKHKGEIFLSMSLILPGESFESTFNITNWRIWNHMNTKPIFLKNNQFVINYTKKRGTESRLILCNSLEDAKKKADEIIMAKIFKVYFEPIPERKVLIERKRTKKKKSII